MEETEVEDETGPMRTCIATRQVRALDELIRFVLSPDGVVVPDIRRKLPGRGVWVTATKAAVTQAIKRQAFARGFKSPARVPPTLADDVEEVLTRFARESVSLANKAGLVVSGFVKVEKALAKGGIQALIHALDAAPDGVRKLAQVARRYENADLKAVPVVSALPSGDLDLALGRSHVIHAALLVGPASRACLARLSALERYRAGDGAPAPEAASEPVTETAREPAGCERNE